MQGQTLALKATVLEIPSSSTAEFLAIYVVMIIEIVGLRESNTNDLRELGDFFLKVLHIHGFRSKKHTLLQEHLTSLENVRSPSLPILK